VKDLIRITRRGGDVRVMVGDVEVPADAIVRDSVWHTVDSDAVPTVRLELMAHRVEIVDTLGQEVVDLDKEAGGGTQGA
jgi:hypothetical protein